jgi:telomerase protein component 1
MASTWHEVKIFISSTFSDMHAERDYLIKFVFPALREKLEKYRIHLVDIDLRWGVTGEQADNDQALDLCLQQIDECRPLFIGILGERYGYVPNSFNEEALSNYGWIQHQTGKSITELEILYGVLRNHNMKNRAFFYFRDKSFIADVPESKQKNVLSEEKETDKKSDKDSSKKLEGLKQEIRDVKPPVPVYENYPCEYHGLKINWRIARQKLNKDDQITLEEIASDGIVDTEEYATLNKELQNFVDQNSVVYLDGLKEFGNSISKQLEHAILKPEAGTKLAKHLEGLQESQDPLEEEADFHERFMESRLRVYAGRESIQRALMKFAKSDYKVPCLVRGPSGSGKSAVMSKFVRGIKKEQDEKNLLLIPHFIGASPDSTSLRKMLYRFCSILKNEFGFEEEIPLDTNSLRTLFHQLIINVPEDRQILFVIDALNQLDETDNAHALTWLPWKLPAHVKIVTSCIDDKDRDETVLKSFQHHDRNEYQVKPLSDEERFEIVKQVPSLSAKALDQEQVSLLLTNPATENPLFLLVALEELRGFGSFEELDFQIASFPRSHEKNTLK